MFNILAVFDEDIFINNRFNMFKKILSESKLLKSKPKMLWEYRIYSKGSLLENGVVLNDTATFIYQECNSKNTVSDILSRLCKNYDIDKKTAKKDLSAIINSLINENAIKI